MAGAIVRQIAGSNTLTAPTDGDIYVVEGPNQNQTIDTSVDLSALAEGLERVEFRDGANVSFNADSPLKVDLDYSPSAHMLFAQRGGQVFYWPGGDNALCNRIKHVGTGALHVISGGTVTDWEQASGRGRVAAASICTNCYVSGGAFTMEYNATAWTGGRLAGQCMIHRAFSGTVKVAGAGSIITVGKRLPSDTIPTGGTLEIAGGRVIWKGGNITNLYLYGDGMFDFSQAVQNVTITNLYADGPAYARSIFRTGQYKVTVTNAYINGSPNDDFAA